LVKDLRVKLPKPAPLESVPNEAGPPDMLALVAFFAIFFIVS